MVALSGKLVLLAAKGVMLHLLVPWEPNEGCPLWVPCCGMALWLGLVAFEVAGWDLRERRVERGERTARGMRDALNRESSVALENKHCVPELV